MANKKNNKAKIQTFIGRDDVNVVANIQENCILTTEDKIQILYNEYNEIRRYSGEFWTFFGLFIALLTTVLTCEFKSALGMSSSVVEALYIIATIISFSLTIYAFVMWMINRKKLTFEYFMNQIRGNHANE